MARYKIIACHVLWRELSYYASLSEHVFDITFLKQGLHNTPDLLRTELQTAIDAADPACEAILVGYGLCSNGVEGITARTIPLVVMKGHDCITFFLGSKERYREYFDAHPGTYWYTPGWIDTNTQPGKERYEQTLASYVDHYGEESALYLMEMEQAWFKNYNNATYLDFGFGDSARYKAYTKECAAWLKWNYDELEGEPKLIKEFLGGRWNPDDFCIVLPGQKVTASFDEQVIKAVETA